MARGTWNLKTFSVGLLYGLVSVTILSITANRLFDFPIAKTGPAFILVLISIFIVQLIMFSQDGRFDTKDMVVTFVLGISLIAVGFTLKTFFPQIFSTLPPELNTLFSAFT